MTGLLLYCLFRVDGEKRLMELVKWPKTFSPSTKHNVLVPKKTLPS